MSIVKFRRGDTLIEVSFAIAVFALVALISITLMNTGVTMSEGNLESSMTRNEIDAQAEALRFIQNAYLAEQELVKDQVNDQQIYRKLWEAIAAQAISANNTIDNLPANLADHRNGTYTGCEAAYKGTTNIFNLKSFVINTRNINPYDINGTLYRSQYNTGNFVQATLYPRIIFSNGFNTNDNSLTETGSYYNRISRVEGIWVIAVKEKDYNPEFYDFHIRTCWYAPGKDNPSTISTIVRLYNPDYNKVK
ncbi:prepilin-type N-terminal cleavage/methylation domain-containing protein [Candidatus Saccharibacteria bacterium]|nr:prepilin-type N-terminal cleavage/methylation domain-containing protein [Candidatus Saccharibacteria bacterium]MBR3323265.1 prepilin-type N-terminal cleavage/methylation domain-containing protein [Candidatus Saccharibacteria bacterium]